MQELLNIRQLEFLTKLGAEETTIDILGTKFRFRTLNVEENTQAFELPTKEKYEDDIAKFNAMRVEILSRAVISINEYEIPENFRDQLRMILKRMQQGALNKLFAAYQELVGKQETRLSHAEKQAIAGTAAQVVELPTSTEEKEEKPAEEPVERPKKTGAVNIAVDMVDPGDLAG